MNRMEAVLDSNRISYFAMETRTSQTNWVLHIPDQNRKVFDELVVTHNFNLTPMNHSFWVQDRDIDAMRIGGKSKIAQIAVLVVLIVMVIVAIVGFIL